MHRIIIALVLSIAVIAAADRDPGHLGGGMSTSISAAPEEPVLYATWVANDARSGRLTVRPHGADADRTLLVARQAVRAGLDAFSVGDRITLRLDRPGKAAGVLAVQAGWPASLAPAPVESASLPADIDPDAARRLWSRRSMVLTRETTLASVAGAVAAATGLGVRCADGLERAAFDPAHGMEIEGVPDRRTLAIEVRHELRDQPAVHILDAVAGKRWLVAGRSVAVQWTLHGKQVVIGLRRPGWAPPDLGAARPAGR